MGVERFEELVAWREAMDLAVTMHRLIRATDIAGDPVLSDQLWRCASSIPANIAEGFEKFTRPEFARYLAIAKASCGELRSHLLLCQRIGLLDATTARPVLQDTQKVSNLVGALRSSISRPRQKPT